MHHSAIFCATLAVACFLAVTTAAPALTIVAVNDSGAPTLWRNDSGIITTTNRDSFRGFFGNTTFAYSIAPRIDNTGIYLWGNGSDDAELADVLSFASNTLQQTQASVAYDPANYSIPYFSGAGYDIFVPQDEGGRFAYVGNNDASSFLIKLDLNNNSAVVEDAEWPVPSVCYYAPEDEELRYSGMTANATHFFVSCYYGQAGLVVSFSRSNPSSTNGTVIYYNSTLGQASQPTSDGTYVYWSLWPGNVLSRYNYKTGVLEVNWVSLPGVPVTNSLGPWRVRLYREQGTPVLYVLMYGREPVLDCLRRVDPATGTQLSVVWNNTDNCLGGLNDLFIVPNGEIEYAHQPYTALPPVSAPASPIAAPVAAPASSPVASGGSPTASNAPVASNGPTASATPTASASTPSSVPPTTSASNPKAASIPASSATRLDVVGKISLVLIAIICAAVSCAM